MNPPADSGSDHPPDRGLGTDEPDGESTGEQLSEIAGHIAKSLVDNPLFGQAVGAAYEARNAALGAQRTALGALDISSATDVERLERRIRLLGDRLEALEAEVDRMSVDLRSLRETIAIEGGESRKG